MISPEFNGTPAPKNTAPTWRYCCAKSLSVQQKRFLYHAAGRILAQDVTARMDVPASTTPKWTATPSLPKPPNAKTASLPSDAKSPPADPPTFPPSDDLTYPIMTGAPMPKGYDAVIPVEQSERIEYPDLPESSAAPAKRSNSPPASPDSSSAAAAKTSSPARVLARAGERITPALLVRSPPRVCAPDRRGGSPRAHCAPAATKSSPALKKTEAPPPRNSPGPDFDANGPMLTAMLREDGARSRIAIGDDPVELLHRLTAEYESFKPDIIITSGGISHGKYEVVRNAIAKAHEADILVPISWFGHVSQQPGGPKA